MTGAHEDIRSRMQHASYARLCGHEDLLVPVVLYNCAVYDAMIEFFIQLFFAIANLTLSAPYLRLRLPLPVACML